MCSKGIADWTFAVKAKASCASPMPARMLRARNESRWNGMHKNLVRSHIALTGLLSCLSFATSNWAACAEAPAPDGAAGAIQDAPPPATPPGPLSGLSAAELRARWGEPKIARKEANGAMWQYAGRNCVVLVYLYSGESGGLEAAYAEARPGGADGQIVQDCLNGMRQRPETENGRKMRGPKLTLKPG
jgi:hypothetical protein